MAEHHTCRGCGCTEHEPCPHGCTWVTASADVCSACAIGAHLSQVIDAFTGPEGCDVAGAAAVFLDTFGVDGETAARRFVERINNGGSPKPAEPVPLLYGAAGEVLATTTSPRQRAGGTAG